MDTEDQYWRTPAQQNRPRQQHSGEWLMGRIALLLSAYRKDDYENPELFVEQARANLSRYSKEVVEYVTSPTTGLQTRSQWPPSLAEIIKACDEHMHSLEMRERYTAMGPTRPARFSPGPAPGMDYDTLTAKHGRAVGVFEAPGDKWNRDKSPPRKPEGDGFRRFTADDMRAND